MERKGFPAVAKQTRKVFYPTLPSSKRISFVIRLCIRASRTNSREEELVLGSQKITHFGPRTDPLRAAHRPSFTEGILARPTGPSGPGVRSSRHLQYLMQLRPHTIAHKMGPLLITPYTSRPSVQPDAVRRIYEKVDRARGLK
jgi:hypothetical protein